MVTVFVDTSVILRFVLGQSPRLAQWSCIESALASELLEVECFRVLDRFRLQGVMNDEQLAARRSYAHTLTRSMRFVKLSGEVLRRAKSSFPTTVGTLDALHLASALLFQERESEDFAFATHDVQLGMAARACGLQVIGIEG